MTAVAFTVPGEAHGKGRPRFRRAGAFVRTYTDAKTASYEGKVRQLAAAAMDGRAPSDSAIAADILWVVGIPPSWSKRKRLDAVSGALLPVSQRIDLDNVVKAVADACNGVVYADDRQIVRLSAAKVYGDAPRVCVQFLNVDRITHD